MIDWTTLYPQFARSLGVFMGLLSQQGVKARGTDGYRSLKRQADLYAQGRTAAGQIVTNAKPGSSAHNWGCAADFVLLDEGGKATYEGDWDSFGRCVRTAGLTWGGDFKHLKDRPHVEYPSWRQVRSRGWKPQRG